MRPDGAAAQAAQLGFVSALRLVYTLAELAGPGLDFFFFQAEDGIRDTLVTGVQTCALPIWTRLLRDDTAGDAAAAVAGGIGLVVVGIGVHDERGRLVAEHRVGAGAERDGLRGDVEAALPRGRHHQVGQVARVRARRVHATVLL